jgi:steroid Delta-isomerase
MVSPGGAVRVGCRRGKAAIAAFYDSAIEPTEQIKFEIERSYLCGDEVADVGVVRARLSNGQVAIVPGVFTYRSDGDGRLISSRAYWEYNAAELLDP